MSAGLSGQPWRKPRPSIPVNNRIEKLLAEYGYHLRMTGRVTSDIEADRLLHRFFEALPRKIKDPGDVIASDCRSFTNARTTLHVRRFYNWLSEYRHYTGTNPAADCQAPGGSSRTRPETPAP